MEVAILAVVVMYGMYLIATDGVSEKTTVSKDSKGNYKETTEKRDSLSPLSSQRWHHYFGRKDKASC